MKIFFTDIRFLFILINVFVLVNFSFAANEEIDSLENKLASVNNSEKATILNKLSEYYLPVETNKSLKYAKEALRISIMINDSVNLSLAYLNLGRFQANYGDSEKALGYYLNSLQISEQINYPEGLGRTYNNLGLIHWKLGENKKAITNFKLAQDYFMKINNIEHIASTINNLGIIYVENQDYENGIKNFKKSLHLMKELGNLHKVAIALNNVGYVYELMEDYESGLYYYSKSLKLADSLQLKWSIANSLSNIGNIYYKKGQYFKAIKLIDQALLIAQEINAKTIILECADQLSTIYSESGSYKKAFEYNKLHSSIKDSIVNEKKNKQIIEMQTRYETEKKEKEIQLLQTKNEIASLKLNRQKNFNYFIISVVLFLSIIIYIIYSAYKSKQKINKLLQLKNQEITQQKEEIQAQTDSIVQQAYLLEQANIELEKLSIVARETNNGVIIMDEHCNLEWVNPGFTRMFGFTLTQLEDERGRNLYQISNNLLIREKLDELKKNKKSIIYESENITRSGKKLWVQTAITPILNDKKEIIKLIAIDSDITVLKKAEKEIIHQRDEISEQKKEITDSIIYSKHIQTAILPSRELIDTIIPESFILYKPKDIIGGDFYWINKNNNTIVVAVVDCTGHGVPGALMSMLGITFLNEIVKNKNITDPGEILDLMRLKIIRTLHQTDKVDSSKDGMDIAICTIFPELGKLKYAGANNPVTLISDDNVIELKPDKMPVSLTHKIDTSFTTQEENYNPGTMLYLYSDGYSDQFGGSAGKKFLKNKFKNLLKEMSQMNINLQYETVKRTFESWKGNEEQVDDVLVIGIKL